MHLCRAALQRFSPLARHFITQRAILQKDVVPRRLMSSVPGGTGESLIYVVVCGGAFAAAITYAYRTVTSDSVRYSESIKRIEAQTKNEWTPKPWPPQSPEDGKEAEEAAEEVVEVAAEAPAEAIAEEAPPAPVELVAEAKKVEPATALETAAEAVAEAAEVVAEVAGVVEETAEEVATVAHEVEKIAEEVEAVAKELETPALPVEEEAQSVPESNGTEAASQEGAVTESVNTEG